MAKRKALEPEPSILDWFNSVIRLKPIPIPESAPSQPAQVRAARPKAVASASAPSRLEINVNAAQLRTPVALLLAFFAQVGLQQHESVGTNVVLYLLAAGLIGWGVWAGDYGEVSRPRTRSKSAVVEFRRKFLLAGLGLAGLTYLTSGDNTFRLPTIVFWIATMLLVARAFWIGPLPGSDLPARIRKFAAKPVLKISLDGWSLLVVGTFALAAFFRFTQLAEVPFEMISDHAEKYLDIVDVINGDRSIFFPRNAGREPIQFYATAAAIEWFGADYSYLTLKNITAMAGLLTLPFMYLLGKEIGGRGVGLGAMALTGIAYWPNIISRVGMRLPFFPIFLAPALYMLLRGFRRRSQNDFVISGLLVGLSVYGYTPARITPFVIGLGLLLYLAHRISRGHRRQAVAWFAIAGLLAVMAATPFLHTAVEFQDEVFYRTVTRITEAERPLPGPALAILASNFWNALRMFSWDFGEIWVLALPFRPALDWITGGLFHLGVVYLIVRYAKGRNWVDLFLLLSIPILLLPSVLSLAFPGENPHPSRMAGAIIPVFTITAITLLAVWAWAQNAFSEKWGPRIGGGLVGAMFLVSSNANYDLVIRDYGDMARERAWNTSEAGAAVRGFAGSVGSFENVYIVAWPHWMDSRLVALVAGRPNDDFGLWPEQIDELPETDRPLLFLLHPDDEQDLVTLQGKYPAGSITRHVSEVVGRDFLLFLVPGEA